LEIRKVTSDGHPDATHDLALVTRNVKDFAALPITTINHWKRET
jgi:hypothetical protein